MSAPVETGPHTDDLGLEAKTDARAWRAVWVLALGTFLFVTTELIPVGLLPSISAGMDVSIGTAGLLVSVYGGVAALTAVPLTSLFRRVDRRWLLVGLLGALVLGNLISAAAPNYLVLMASRILIAFAHGVFWATTPAVGAGLVSSRHAVRAIAVVLGGISVASVVGVPATTALGQATNWRFAFLVIAALGLLAMFAVLGLLPRVAPSASGGLYAIPALLRNRPFRTAILVAGLTMMGHYLAYTYLTPYLEEIIGISPGMVSVLLLTFGAAGIAGNFLASGAIARSLRGSLMGAAGLLTVSLVVMSAGGGGSRALGIVMLVTWGLSYAVLPVCLQTWVLRSAPQATDAASSVYVSVFNASIALGALSGSMAVRSVGLEGITWLGACLVGLGLLVAVIYRGVDDRSEPTAHKRVTTS